MKDYHNILLATDFDRTFTDLQGKVPQANLDAVAEFAAGGGIFTVATGRSYHMFAHDMDKVPLGVPVILANGAAMLHTDSGEVEVLHPLPDNYMETAKALHNQFPQLRLELQGSKNHACFVHDPSREAHLDNMEVPHTYPTWEEVDSTDPLIIAFFTPNWEFEHAHDNFVDDFDRLAQIVETQYPEYHFARSMPRMLELFSNQAGKGPALRNLAKDLGCDRLVCAGDAKNDLSMLDEADGAYITGDCQPDLLGRGYTQLCPCGDGMIKEIVALEGK